MGRKQVKKQVKLEKIIEQFNAAKEVEVVGPFRIFCWFVLWYKNHSIRKCGVTVIPPPGAKVPKGKLWRLKVAPF